MSEEQNHDRSERDAELEREIRGERKFTLGEAIGRMAGPGAMKGASPVTPTRQAEAVLEDLLRKHLDDAPGSLRTVLQRRVMECDLLMANPQQPAVVLAAYVRRVLETEVRVGELVREADMEWGRAVGERPHFDREGEAAHPDDPYTSASVMRGLNGLLERLGGEPAAG